MAFQDLITVKFEDVTNHTAYSEGDVIGLPFNYHWGECETMAVLNRSAFYQMFPESLPMGITKIKDVTPYYAYGQIKQSFDAGAGRVEVVRVKGGWKYRRLAFGVDGEQTTATPSLGADRLGGIDESATAIAFVLKHRGCPPQSIASGYSELHVRVVSTLEEGIGVMLTVSVIAKDADGNEQLLERMQGGIDPTQQVDGQPFYIDDVVSRSSRIIGCALGDVDISEGLTFEGCIYAYDAEQVMAELTADCAVEYADAIAATYSDMEQSRATILISPLPTVALDNTILTIADSRKNCTAAVGYPVAATFGKAAIKAHLSELYRTKFGIYIAGREMANVFGLKYLSQGMGTWAGCTAKVARDLYTNQLASARTYGQFPSVLAATLNFDEVLELHELGIGSIYQSYIGPQIFAVRSLHERQTSYFGQFNIGRVVASLLRDIYPIALGAIHTDAAQNPITRAGIETAINAVLDRNKPNNLRPQSVADLGGDINSDINTQGGRVLNIVLSCWFIGLVERVNIRIVATDSSVSAVIE